MDKIYDIVIVGAGAVGTNLANKVKRENPSLSIIILEAGADRSAERLEMSLSFANSINKSSASPYDKNKDTYLNSPDIPKNDTQPYYRFTGESVFKSNYIKMAGGSTWHWLGNVPRFLPTDFRLKDEYGVGFNWPITYDDLEKYYCQAETELGVSGNHEQWNNLYGAYRTKPFPMPEIWPSYSDSVLKKTLDDLEIDEFKVKLFSTPQARNSQSYQGRPACVGNSSCLPICPIHAKYDGTVHVNLAKKAGVEIQFKSIVYKIEAEENNKNISKVHYKDWDGNKQSVTGKIFVIAAHSIESAILLLSSNIANSSGKVGKYLMDHPQGYGVGLSKEPLYTFRGPPTTSGIDTFREGKFRAKHAAFRMSIGNDGWGRWKGKDNLEELVDRFTINNTTKFSYGKDLRKSIEERGIRLFRFSFSTEMLPLESNSISLSNDVDPITQMPYPQINFKLDDDSKYNQKGFEYASSVILKMFDALKIEERDTINNNKDYSGAYHVMGTTKMGFDSKSSVVDSNCNSFDHPNLYIVGPGVFPTVGTANPTLTAVALSLRLADYLLKILK